MDESIKITNLREAPELIPEAAAWFAAKWGIPREEYEASMRESAESRAPVPQWFAVTDARGKIIFIEEVDEPVTKIEKWCYQLRNAGKFKDCKGVLLGQLTDISNEFMPEYTALDCIGEILADYDIPVMYDLQSGHGRPMITLPLGALCTMDTTCGYIGFAR